MSSLRDQLLKAGLTTEHKARQVRTEQKKTKKAPKVATADNLQKHIAEQRKAEQEKAAQLNQKRQAELKEREEVARIKQILEHHNQKDIIGNQVFNFAYQGKIKELPVNEKTRALLSKGRLAIAQLEGAFFVIPEEPAAKIAEVNPSYIVLHVEPEQKPDIEDPYKDFAVPDDLVW